MATDGRLTLDLSDPRLAAEVVSLVDRRVAIALHGRPESRYGIVTALDAPNSRCSVAVGANASASPGFVYTAAVTPQVGDRVRVVIAGADRYVEANLSRHPAASNPGTILAAGFDSLNTGSYVVAANAATDLTDCYVTLATPASGAFRVFVAGSLRLSSPSAANLEAAVKLVVGTTPGGTLLDHIALQNAQLVAGEEYSYSITGWIDSNGSGGPRVIAGLVNGISVTATWWIRSTVAQTVAVYADASARYVTNLYAWIVAL